MACKKEMLLPERIGFRALCREYTGQGILDSGSVYGRHHERPEIHKDSAVLAFPNVVKDVDDLTCGVHLGTGAFLDAVFDINREVQAAFERFAEDRQDESWDDLIAQFMAEWQPGWVCHCDGYTYNEEHDLTQDFRYEVWAAADAPDWIYADDALTVIRTHNGCDARGGFSRPVWGRFRGDSTIPSDLSVSVLIKNGRDLKGKSLTAEQCETLGETWRSGYSSAPLYYFGEASEKVIRTNPAAQTATVKLKTGETVKVIFAEPIID